MGEAGNLRIVFTISEHFDREEGFGYVAFDSVGKAVGWSTNFASLLTAMTTRAEKLRWENEEQVAIGLRRGEYPLPAFPPPIAHGHVLLVRADD